MTFCGPHDHRTSWWSCPWSRDSAKSQRSKRAAKLLSMLPPSVAQSSLWHSLDRRVWSLVAVFSFQSAVCSLQSSGCLPACLLAGFFRPFHSLNRSLSRVITVAAARSRIDRQSVNNFKCSAFFEDSQRLRQNGASLRPAILALSFRTDAFATAAESHTY